jgi:hypothetical protein
MMPQIFVKHIQIREGRKQTLSESLKKEFRLTMNILRTTISEDVYEVIVAVISLVKTYNPSLEIQYFFPHFLN